MRAPKDKDIDFSDSPEWTKEDFKRARHFTPEERAMFRAAYINMFGHPPPKRGPLHKHPSERYVPTYIKLHPKVIQWARREGKRRGLGYQTIINQALLRRAA
jgi:uncharacterized protein (DUF4415 family)